MAEEHVETLRSARGRLVDYSDEHGAVLARPGQAG